MPTLLMEEERGPDPPQSPLMRGTASQAGLNTGGNDARPPRQIVGMRLGDEAESGYTIIVGSRGAVQFAIEVARIAHDLKSENVIAFDLRGISSITDFAIIASGASDRQIRGVADAVVEYGRKVGEKPYGLCGHENAAWVIVDYVDVVLHLFARAYRDYYDLELLWGDAPRIEWARSETA